MDIINSLDSSKPFPVWRRWTKGLASVACLAGWLIGADGAQAGLLWDPFFAGHHVVSLTNGASVSVPMGFSLQTPLDFTYSSVFINDNGHLTFDESFTNLLGRNNLRLFQKGGFGQGSGGIAVPLMGCSCAPRPHVDS